jgi:hypothetical protein
MQQKGEICLVAESWQGFGLIITYFKLQVDRVDLVWILVCSNALSESGFHSTRQSRSRRWHSAHPLCKEL